MSDRSYNRRRLGAIVGQAASLYYGFRAGTEAVCDSRATFSCREPLLDHAVRGLVALGGRGEPQAGVLHVLDQLVRGLGLRRPLAVEVVLHLLVVQGPQGLVELVQEALGVHVLRGRQIADVSFKRSCIVWASFRICCNVP